MAETALEPAVNREHIGSRPPSYAAYKIEGCRCYRCCLIRNAYDDDRRCRIIAGTWQPFMDAAPVREHLQHLRSNGVGLRRIEELTGIARSSLVLIVDSCADRKAREQVRTEHARAILGLRPGIDTASDGALIDAAGTVRRIRALIAVGFTQDYLARRLGVSPGNFADIPKRRQVTAKKARAMRDVYDELSMKSPAALGILPASIGRSRRHAAAQGWAKPLEWDDDEIDDPDATPRRGDDVPRPAGHRSAELREEALFLINNSPVNLAERRDRDAVAAQLGIGTDYLDKLLKTAA